MRISAIRSRPSPVIVKRPSASLCTGATIEGRRSFQAAAPRYDARRPDNHAARLDVTTEEGRDVLPGGTFLQLRFERVERAVVAGPDTDNGNLRAGHGSAVDGEQPAADREIVSDQSQDVCSFTANLPRRLILQFVDRRGQSARCFASHRRDRGKPKSLFHGDHPNIGPELPGYRSAKSLFLRENANRP